MPNFGCQLDITWMREPQIEKLPTSDWTVGMSLKIFA